MSNILVILISFASGFVTVFSICIVHFKFVYKDMGEKGTVGCDSFVPFLEPNRKYQRSIDGRNALDEFIVK